MQPSCFPRKKKKQKGFFLNWNSFFNILKQIMCSLMLGRVIDDTITYLTKTSMTFLLCVCVHFGAPEHLSWVIGCFQSTGQISVFHVPLLCLLIYHEHFGIQNLDCSHSDWHTNKALLMLGLLFQDCLSLPIL